MFHIFVARKFFLAAHMGYLFAQRVALRELCVVNVQAILSVDNIFKPFNFYCRLVEKFPANVDSLSENFRICEM
jgi:hypothetical protein